MTKLRVSLVAALLAIGALVNVFVSPQIYVPRPPVFNGVDIAQTWEWRSMAIDEHSWWLSYHFPDATVRHAGYLRPPGKPGALEVGIQFSSGRDAYLPITIDDSEPPLDVSELDIRDDLLRYAKVFSRIHCRDFQSMVVRDSCFYFVAWDDETLPAEKPEFVGVRTFIDADSEVALVERGLLERLSPVALEDIPDYFEVDPS